MTRSFIFQQIGLVLQVVQLCWRYLFNLCLELLFSLHLDQERFV
jgi:hypothetical protein